MTDVARGVLGEIYADVSDGRADDAASRVDTSAQSTRRRSLRTRLRRRASHDEEKGQEGTLEQEQCDTSRDKYLKRRLKESIAAKLASTKWWGQDVTDWIVETKGVAVLVFDSDYKLDVSRTVNNLMRLREPASHWVALRYTGDHFDSLSLPLNTLETISIPCRSP